MANRKKKWQKERSPYTGTIIFVLAAVVAGMVLLKYLENLKYRNQLLERSEKINLRLESSLFKTGLSKKDITSSSEELREIKNGKILYCKRVILLKKDVKVENVARAIKELSKIRGVGVEEVEDQEVIKKGGIKYIVKLNTSPIQEIVIYPGTKEEEARRMGFYEPSQKKPMIALIIDDLGASLKQVRPFLEIDEPINFAILPNLSLSRRISRLASSSGKEVLLHCPMEPEEYPKIDPGSGGIFSKMTKDEILEVLEKNLESVPDAVGFNNHMGSRITQDTEKMEIILDWAKEKNLFFVDSRTTPKTRGTEIARELNVKVGERKIFLDNIKEIPEIEKQISKLVSLAKKDGRAIGIGHPFRETAIAIQMMIPFLKKEGIELVPVSLVVE